LSNNGRRDRDQFGIFKNKDKLEGVHAVKRKLDFCGKRIDQGITSSVGNGWRGA